MPKLEPKAVQRELEQGWLWPVYWLYGAERMKSRELLKRIHKAALGEGGALGGLAEESFDGTEDSVASVLDAARSLSLGGGTRFVVVREAHALFAREAQHALRELELLAELCGPRAERRELSSVCVFLSQELDGRKKLSKLLLEKAAVVPCEEVSESERESWIAYLSKKRGLALPAELIPRLCALEPWSLDIIDQELEKFSLSGEGDALQAAAMGSGACEEFLSAFFAREPARALQAVGSFADHPDESLPLLGLLAWNLRQLALWLADRKAGARPGAKLNPYVAGRLREWSARWSLEDVLGAQAFLQELDFALKQRPLLPLGIWDELVLRAGKPAR